MSEERIRGGGAGGPGGGVAACRRSGGSGREGGGGAAFGGRRDLGDGAVEERLRQVVAELHGFRPRQPHEHPQLLGGEGTIPFERLVAGLSRGREAIELAIGEGLRALGEGDRLMELGFSRVKDYAQQRLGMAATTAWQKERLARELARRPLLREAVRSGSVLPRKALEVLGVARGESEADWVHLAATLSVRELRRRVARARGAGGGGRGGVPRDPSGGEGGGPPGVAEDGAAGPTPDGRPREGAGEGPGEEASASVARLGDEEPWEVLSFPLGAADREAVDEAMRLAGEELGQDAPAWRRLEAMSQEFLGSHRDDRLDAEPPAPGVRTVPLADRERAAELETRGWFWLEAVRPVPAPELAAMDARALDARLRGLVERRRRWDGLFGMLALDFVRRRMATDLGFAGVGQWVAERLGMSLRAFQQRVWVERRLEALPRLRDAMERGELSYEKVRLVAGVADGRTLHGWVRRAKGMTCAELERAVTAAERAQACGRGRFQARLPAWVAGLVRDAMCAAKAASGAALDPGACLGRVARHFVETWGPLERRRRTPSGRARERDGGWCSAPACSRPGAQGHHVVLRSRGGGDGLENLTPLCAPHHLRGVHAGRLRVRGTAPGALAWEIRSGATWEPFVP